MHKKLTALLISVLMLAGSAIMFSGCSEFIDAVLEEDAKSQQTEKDEKETEEAETEAETETTSEETTVNATETEEPAATTKEETEVTFVEADKIDIDGVYTSKDDVALYIYTYGELPKNFMTKKEARELGWEGGSLEDYAPGMCIGGDYFGNYEGLLPEESGREYHECDIDTLGAKSRGPKRIIFSNDGLIYYTSDHYESFTLLYGEE